MIMYLSVDTIIKYILTLVLIIKAFTIFDCERQTGIERMSSIKVVSLDVPAKVKKGSEVQLNCLYDLGNATLYSLKWFYSINDLVRDEKEFYRFTPRGKPIKQVFPLKGLDVDFQNSNGGTIRLMVTDSMSGTYKCEISAEGTFQTVAAEKLMKVEAANRGESLHRPLLHNKLMFMLCTSCAIFSWITSYYSLTLFNHISDSYCSISSINASFNQTNKIKNSNHNQIIDINEKIFKTTHVSLKTVQ